MSILFFRIVNLKNKIVIGTYKPLELNNSSLIDSIEKKSQELTNQIKLENGIEKKVINFQTTNDKKIDIIYYLTNNGILYIAFVEILSYHLESFKEESIFELFEEVDNKSIKSNIEKNGKLSMVGQQNLKFAIEKYQNTYFTSSGIHNTSGLIEEAPPQKSKINAVNEQINDVKNDMKENVKNMITNIQDINEMEGKSVAIKDSSFQFRRDSLSLEKKMKRNVLRNRIILIVSVVLVLILIFYIFIK